MMKSWIMVKPINIVEAKAHLSELVPRHQQLKRHEAILVVSWPPHYLAEFEYRFNRRYDLAAMIPRLAWAAVRTPPMPYRLLKLAERHA